MFQFIIDYYTHIIDSKKITFNINICKILIVEVIFVKYEKYGID